MSGVMPCLASEWIMPTWIAPKLPPPASTKAVFGRSGCKVGGKTSISPGIGASVRAVGRAYSSGGVGDATTPPVVLANARTHTVGSFEELLWHMLFARHRPVDQRSTNAFSMTKWP